MFGSRTKCTVYYVHPIPIKGTSPILSGGGKPILPPNAGAQVLSAETRPFFRPEKYSPGGQVYHWYNNAESYWLLGKAMAMNMLILLAPLPHRPPLPPPAPPAPAPPTGANQVVIYQQGGNGTLTLGPANFSATKGMPGKGWDACPGASGPARFDNGGAHAHLLALAAFVCYCAHSAVMLTIVCCLPAFYACLPACLLCLPVRLPEHDSAGVGREWRWHGGTEGARQLDGPNDQPVLLPLPLRELR